MVGSFVKPPEFLEQYNVLRVQHGGIAKEQTKKNIKTAEHYLTWCTKNEVEDPVLYLKSYINFTARTGREFPKLGFLRSNHGLEIWRKFAEGHALEGRANERLTEEMNRRPPPAIKLRPHQELFKSYYVGNRATCARYGTHTGGFNPQSTHCGGCDAVASCRSLNA